MEMNRYGIFLGYDPGTKHSAIALINSHITLTQVTLFQIDLERSDDPVARTIGVYELFNRCIQWLYSPMYACLEGASYGDRYRQVELAEVRAMAMLWCHQHNYETKVVSPLKIRKAVFGNGRVKAQDVWANIPQDAANALACACYATSIGT